MESVSGILSKFAVRMDKMSRIYKVYRVVRSLLFGMVLAIAAISLLTYILVSLPPVQRKIKDIAQKELSAYLKTEVKIGSLSIYPFNRLEISDAHIPSPDGRPCVDIEKLGAGIDIWKLLLDKKIEITYAEIIGLDFRLRKPAPDKKLNIQFLIDAFKPKKPGAPPTKFDLRLRSIVIRSSYFSFDKEWLPAVKEKDRMDFNHIRVSNIRADINIPRLRNDDFIIELRSLALQEHSGLKLENLIASLHITPQEISLRDLRIDFPGTCITPADMTFRFNGFPDFVRSLLEEKHSISLRDNRITLSDFSSLVPGFSAFPFPLLLTLSASGSEKEIKIDELLVSSFDRDIDVEFFGEVYSLANLSKLRLSLPKLKVSAEASKLGLILDNLVHLPANTDAMLRRLGNISLEAHLEGSRTDAVFTGIVSTALGSLDLDASAAFATGRSASVKANASTDGLDLGKLFERTDLGRTAFDLSGAVDVAGRDINGNADLNVAFIEYAGRTLTDITASVTKNREHIEGNVSVADALLAFNAAGSAILAGDDSSVNASLELEHFVPSEFGSLQKYAGYTAKGYLEVDGHGLTPDKFTGTVIASDVAFSHSAEKALSLSSLSLEVGADDEGNRSVLLASDWVHARMNGKFNIARLPESLAGLAVSAVPALAASVQAAPWTPADDYFTFDINILPEAQDCVGFFNLPFGILTDIPLKGSYHGQTGKAELFADIPYLRQGKDKLVRDTRLSLGIEAPEGTSSLAFSTLWPGKKGDIGLKLNLSGKHNDFTTGIGWKIHRDGKYEGNAIIDASLLPMAGSKIPDVSVRIRPSQVDVADVPWHIADSRLKYSGGKLYISGLRVWHDNQFVFIDGTASALPGDTVKVTLSDFNLDYLFETLNINYVTFGGDATGEVAATQVFSKNPQAFTKELNVRNLTYNGALLGDFARLRSHWDPVEKKVAIGANIFSGNRECAKVDGGVWIGADSLCFDFDTDRINVRFLKPFMAAFCSDLDGYASGKCRLFGNFHDIDLIGRVHADTIRMKVDYTNTWYGGSDSVFLSKGKIEIPEFRVYDKFGRSAKVTGTVRHDYFHNPSFEFKMSEARQLLAYDTYPKINPDWYGTVFVNGSASIKGRPGIVSILVDATTAAGTNFTYVLSDNVAAEEYTFLSFSDRRKEALLAAKPDTVPDFVKEFRRKVEQQQSSPSVFAIDLRVSVTPDARMNIIMDPRAGDKITATGSGPMRIAYDSETDEMTMYGKYTIEQGKYQFTLQDLIIRDFKIKQGSYISFNGNPLTASLDIAATYRVNTNLSDLDKSFTTDKDLNRTNVPVDALLKVGGDLENPVIAYDLELPTLNKDVERKVRSIISTDDMMSRQILYLLALNKFYTPDYMQMSGSNNELASVASSTISSQISNFLGQISDNWSIAPSFRSDRGDFSDTEVDVALSSSLLNNRLLINGNFGYRDRSTSQTTFVGDFDIEYLLNRSGNLRLKAYNHFNDQNYYLKSALTTQGIGVLYRRDFDNPFTFLRKKKKPKDKDKEKEKIKADSVAVPAEKEDTQRKSANR